MDDLTEPKPEPQNPTAEGPGASKPQSAEDSVFYNVMPKINQQGMFVDPKIKVEINAATATAPKKTGIREVLIKNKKYILIGLGAIVAGLGIYFGITKLGGGAYEPENLLVRQSVNPEQKAATKTEGFTTTQEWRNKYFPGCNQTKTCGDAADPDRDGLSNAQEFKLGTDPNNPDSDQDGLADGDETNVFLTDPLNAHTAKNPKFSDSDFIKGGFSITSGKKLTAVEIKALSEKMKQAGLHEPSIKTLNGTLNTLYNFPLPGSAGTSSSTPPEASSTGQSALDQSVEAKQNRDSQRSETIKNIEIALVKYNTDNKTYPQTSDFNVMYLAVKIYLRVATNPIDPVNKPPLVYSYGSNQDGSDFLLTFYSETAGQLIKKTATSAVKDAEMEQASIYDNQRETDLESIRTALLLYSQNNVAGNQDYVFPTKAKYKTSIVPEYISQIPIDPKTGAEYSYEVSTTFNSFTLKTPLDNPAVGTTGYVCNQDSCQNY